MTMEFSKTSLRGRKAWEELGYRVPTKARPTCTERFLVPGYTAVYRVRQLFSFEQVVLIDPLERSRRRDAAELAVETRMNNMEAVMQTVELTIERAWTEERLRELAIVTHGGNYQGVPSDWTVPSSLLESGVLVGHAEVG